MSELVNGKEELIRYFQDGGKPREQWRVGTEYEKVAVSARDGKALAFSGPEGVESLLKEMADRFGWEPEEEHGRVLALRGKKASITIEPGGQIELSGEPCETIHCAYAEFTEHIKQLTEVAHEHGVTVLGLGIQPLSKVEQIELLPKARYGIMFPYMARKGSLGQRMMKQTAGVQANLDYRDESDAIRKFRVSTAIVPIVYALFANSPISDGRLNGYQSYRGHIWTDTDPDRCGILELAFREGASFEDYTDYALDVPMYFLIRHHEYIDLTKAPGITFRQYLEKGFGNERATLEDWRDHLTTIFTEVRLKTYVEVRMADSQPPSLTLALPALFKGVLYESDCLDGAWDLVKRWSFAECLALSDMAHKIGLDARVGRVSLRELGLELLEIASAGLQRQKALNAKGEDESIYLLRLLELVTTGHNQASLTIDRWKGRWNYEMTRLVAGTSYEAAEA